jgi:peptidylprolyl isomerase
VLRKFSVFLALLALLFTAACGSSDSSSDKSKTKTASSSGALSDVKVTGDFGAAPTVKFDAPLKVSKTTSQVLTKGKGAAVADGQTFLVNLLLENGTTAKPIGSTYEQGVPTSFTLDSNSLPADLVTALKGKTQGSRVAVAASAKDIYGTSGNASLSLKATDSLVMVFDIMAVQPTDVLSGPKGAASKLPAGLPKVVEKSGKITTLDFAKAAKKPSKKLQVIPLVTGTGPKTTAGSLVTLNYVGQVYGAKKPFNNSYTTGTPATFPIGINGLIKAWDQALVGVPVGSRVMLVAPPSLAYGATGSKDVGIGKNATLVFVIDILGTSSSS